MTLPNSIFSWQFQEHPHPACWPPGWRILVLLPLGWVKTHLQPPWSSSILSKLSSGSRVPIPLTLTPFCSFPLCYLAHHWLCFFGFHPTVPPLDLQAHQQALDTIGYMMLKQDKWNNDLCPCNGHSPETTQQPCYLLPGPQMAAAFSSVVLKFFQWLQASETHPSICSCFVATLSSHQALLSQPSADPTMIVAA